MEALQQEIVKLLAEGAMTHGEIRNALNGKGWDVSQDEVVDALHRLEGMLIAECVWSINQHEIQTPSDAKPRRHRHAQ